MDFVDSIFSGCITELVQVKNQAGLVISLSHSKVSG